MIIDAVAKGPTIEQAQINAKNALGAPEDVIVSYEVLTMPEKKKFGIFGGKDAEVRAYYEIPDAPVEKPAPKKKSAVPKKEAEKKTAPRKPASEKKTAEKKNTAEKKTAAASAKEETPAAKPMNRAPENSEQVTVPEEKIPEAVNLEDTPEAVRKGYAYLSEIIEKIGVQNATINVLKNEKEYFFQVLSDDDYSLIIGRRGETLDSIQYLVRLAANHGHEEGKVRISINVGDYRQKRERTLREIARKNARRVRKYGRSVTLNPMNPSERRIIHTTVADIDGVVSYSIGEDADRRVVIALAEGVKPLNDRPRRNNNRGGYRSNYRGNGGRGGRRGNGRSSGERRDSSRRTSAASSAPAAERAPRKDVEGMLYGKITPTKKPAESSEPKEED
ncbi:MAG: RNA-binding cell elongation regulator Jag/EloR [Acutalibacteraceae bacterium]